MIENQQMFPGSAAYLANQRCRLVMGLHRGFRFLPVLVFLALIFVFSSLPANELMRVADPLLKHAPKTIPLRKPVPILWLKVGHAIGYAGLGGSLMFALRPITRRTVIGALAFTTVYALSDELHQTFVPGRHAGLDDVLLDVGAAGAAMLIAALILRIRIPRPRKL